MIEYRVTGRARDGGTITRMGMDRDELIAAIEQNRYTIMLVEWRSVGEWGELEHNEARDDS